MYVSHAHVNESSINVIKKNSAVAQDHRPTARKVDMLGVSEKVSANMIVIVRQVVDGSNNMTCQQDSRQHRGSSELQREKSHVEHRLIRGVTYQALMSLLSVSGSIISHAHHGGG